MKITLESTELLVQLNGVPARVWEGETAAGVKCHAFITRIGVDQNDDATEFERELQVCRAPSPELAVYPRRMVL